MRLKLVSSTKNNSFLLTGGYYEAMSKMSTYSLRQKRVRQRKQRYKCKNCHYQFTRATPRGKPQTHKTLAVLLYCHGLSMNAISKLLGSHVTTVLQWIRNFAKKQAPKPALSPGATLVLELDEMWHYIGNKKNKLWIWKALDRNTGHLIDWQCGGTRHTDP